MFLQHRKVAILENLDGILPRVLADLIVEYAVFSGQNYVAMQPPWTIDQNKRVVQWFYDPVTDKTAWRTNRTIEISTRPRAPYYHPDVPFKSPNIVACLQSREGLLVLHETELSLIIWPNDLASPPSLQTFSDASVDLVWPLAEQDVFGLMCREPDVTTFSILSLSSKEKEQDFKIVEKRQFRDGEHGDAWIVGDGHDLVAARFEIKIEPKWTFWNIRTDEIRIEPTFSSKMVPSFHHVLGTDDMWVTDQTDALADNQVEIVQVFEGWERRKGASRTFEYPHELFSVSVLDRDRFVAVSMEAVEKSSAATASVRSLVTGHILFVVSGLQPARFYAGVEVIMGIDKDWFVLREDVNQAVPYVVCLASGQARALPNETHNLVGIDVCEKTGAIVTLGSAWSQGAPWRRWF